MVDRLRALLCMCVRVSCEYLEKEEENGWHIIWKKRKKTGIFLFTGITATPNRKLFAVHRVPLGASATYVVFESCYFEFCIISDFVSMRMLI